MKARSIRFKVNASIIIAGLFTALVCNLIILPFQLRHQKIQWEGIELLLQSVMKQKQEDLANEIFAGQELALAESIREIEMIDGITAVELYDSDGFPLLLDPEIGVHRGTEAVRLSSIPAKPALSAESVSGKPIAVYWTPIEALGERVGYARVLYNLHTFEQQRRLNLALALAVSLAIMAVFAALLNPLLLRMVIRPVMALREAMRQMQDGSLGGQVTIQSHDEIGEVAAAFNGMSREMEQQRLAIENWSTNLEEVVKERTRSLETLSERLRTENRERRDIQEALEQSEAKLRSIVRVAPIGIGLLTRGVITQVNESFCRLLGCAESDFLGKSLTGFFPDQTDWSRLFDAHDARLRTDNGHEVNLVREDGSQISVFLCATDLDPAKPEEEIIFIAMDVTQRKQAEKALRDSEERLLAIFDNAGIGIMVTDRAGRYVQVNAAWSDILGYPSTRLLELDEAAVTDPDDAVAGARHLSEILEGERSHYRFEKRYRREDGRVVWGDVTATPVRNEAGEVQEVIQTVLDITERKRFEQELLRSEKLESIAGLAGGIAHDFNNVLTAIIGNIGLAKMKIDDRAKSLARLEAAEKACSRAQNLAKRLLTFSKGGAPIKETCTISEIIRDSAEFCLTGSNVACTYDLPPDLWSIDADKDQINQVFSNIVLNAVQAMPDGGKLRVRARNIHANRNGGSLPLESDRYVQISFTDQGAGIDKSQLTKIFDPFFSTKRHGSGLGLATAHSIIRRHLGHISVESEPGAGTTFHIFLPATHALDSEAEATGAMVGGKGKRVLIMDDEDLILEISSEILQHLGYQVATAKDGAEAVSRFKGALKAGARFDAVIMDLTIPGGMGGKEAIVEIRRLDPAVRAVVSSGYSNDPVMASYRDYGFDAVAVKPYKIVELGRVLSELLEQPRD